MRSRMRACSGESALAQMDSTPASTRLAEARTDDSTDEPIPTTAMAKLRALTVSMILASAALACTTRVSRPR